MAFDDTGLDLIIADDRPGAHEYLEQTHPEGFFDTIGATVQRIVIQNEATSGTSVTIGTGTKVFTLVAARQWLNGMPVYIVEDGSPSDNVMVGALSADEALGVITVNVTSTKGAGLFTAWTIFAIFATTTVVVTPVSLADGAFGADMSTQSGRATGRLNVEVAAMISVATVADDPAVAEAQIAVWGSVFAVVGINPVGVFIAHEGELAELTAPATWSFTSFTEGDLIFTRDENQLLIAAAVGTDPPFPAAEILTVLDKLEVVNVVIDTTFIFQPNKTHREVFINSSSPVTLTLPNAANNAYTFRVWRQGTGSATINVTGGGTINGGSSISLAAQFDAFFFTSRGSGLYFAN